MWANCNPTVNLNAPCDDIPFASTVSGLEKNTCDKQIKIEKELCLDSDTDFQSFILPLEQDFTKSSKGYASLSATPDKETKSIDYKSKLERSEGNMLISKNLSDSDYVKDTDEKLRHNNSSYSCDHGHTNNVDNLCNEKCTKFIHDTLENIKDNQTGESMFSKINTKIHKSPQKSHNVDHISETEENIVHLEKCIKATHGFSINLFTSGRFSDKSDDSSESDSFYYGCNNSIDFDDDSSSNNSIIFSEDEKIKNWFSSIEIEQAFNTTIYSEISNADDDCLEESKERTTSIFCEDFAIEFGSVSLLENPKLSQRNLHESITAFSSEGYINESFEDDDFVFEKSSLLKDINDSWNDSMKSISGEPRESKRVSFVPLPDLVSVCSYEAEDDDYRYSLYVLDQLRFQNRIKDFESIITPYLTPEHRANIYRRNYLQDKDIFKC